MSEDVGAREREVLQARRESLERLRATGVEPFALRFDPDAHAAELHDRYGSLEPDTVTEDHVSVAGRVVLARRFGKLVFFTLRDRTGDIQLFCSQDALRAEAVRLLDEIDLGDIVGARGAVMSTRKGELSVRVEELVMLTKSLRPLPEKWHGLKDPDLPDRSGERRDRLFVEVRAGLLGVRPDRVHRHLEQTGSLSGLGGPGDQRRQPPAQTTSLRHHSPPLRNSRHRRLAPSCRSVAPIVGSFSGSDSGSSGRCGP